VSENSVEYKKLLDPVYLSKLNSLELISKKVVEGFMVGLHKSPYHGFSAEFSEFRPYQSGDSIQNIDWKIFARSDKYFIKRFEEETNLISHILLDVSKSMEFQSGANVSKLHYGKMLAASLTHLMLNQKDATGLVLFSDKINEFIAPRAIKTHKNVILKKLTEISSSGETETAYCLNLVAEKLKKRGLVIIISDLMDSVDSVLSAIKHIHFKKNEVIVFQLLDPVEVDFSFSSDTIFVDKETGEEITTQPQQIQKGYQEAVRQFINQIQTECRSIGVEYNLLLTNEFLDKALLEYFKKRQKLA